MTCEVIAGHPCYAIREVYYCDGNVTGWSRDPVTFWGDTVEEVQEALENALRDSRERPVLNI